MNNARLLLDKSYNYCKALHTWLSLVVYEKFNIPMKFEDTHPDRVICTDAILGALPHIKELRKKMGSLLDYDKVGSHSLNDFLTLAEKGELEVVRLPYPCNEISSQEEKLYKAHAKKLVSKESIFSSIVNLNNILQTGRILSSTKKKRYKNAYRLVFAVASVLKMLRIKGVELFHILSFAWPRL